MSEATFPDLIKLAWVVDEQLAGRFGYAMIVFPIENKDGNCEFLSRGIGHADMVVLLKSAIASIEADGKRKAMS